MKEKRMRGISIILSVVMLFALCAPLTIAAQNDVQVIMDMDFEENTVGQKPDFNAKGFDLGAVSEVARIYVEEDNGNKVLKGYHGDPTNPEERTRGPRLEKTFATDGLTNLTVSYDVKSSGGKTSATVNFVQSGTNTELGFTNAPSDFKDWTHIEIYVDAVAETAQVYVNGKRYGDAESIKLVGQERFGLRLYVSADIDGSWVMIDNFKITTTDMEYKNVVGMAELTTPFNEKDLLPETGALLTVIDEDFEGYELGKVPPLDAAGGFTDGAFNAVARMYVEAEAGGNQMLKAYHGAPTDKGATVRTPRVDRVIPLSGLKTLTIDLDMQNSGGATKFPEIFFIEETGNTPVYATFSPKAPTTDWFHVKIRCDLVSGVGKVYVDGRLHSQCAIHFGDAKAFRLRINCMVGLDSSWSAIDNVVVTTPDLDIAGIVNIDGVHINWDKIVTTPENKTGMGDVIRKSHPRIFVTDWQTIRDKIATDENAKYWYDVVLRYAESALSQAPVEYYRNLRNNLNDCSNAFKSTVIPIAAAYCLTGDVRYKDRVYKELENVAGWPDWGADAWLCTAHIIYAYALCYDWMYNDWTVEERATILGWIQEKGLREAVLAYEGYSASTDWVHGPNNWNNVCNGSNIIAALAVYDELPDVAEYILRNAAEGLPYSFQELSADGAYAEPLSYWDYGMRHQVKAMAALDSCVAEGKQLPTLLDFADVRGIDKMCDFPIYYNGTTAAFNYGDAGKALIESPIMYWLANKYNKPEYAWYPINLREINPLVPTMAGKEATLSLLWYDPSNAEAGNLPLDKFYKSSEQYGANGISMRSSFADTDALVLMMHAGDQTASHSAMDAGGFVLDWAGKRWVYMYGDSPVPNITGGIYSWPNFHGKSESGGHYDYYHCRAEANNTIIANPRQDMSDMKYPYFAEVDRYESGVNTAYGIIDMTDTNQDYVSAKRGAMMTGNRDVIVIQDEITAVKPSEYYWFANANAEITLAPDGKSALWEYEGDKMLVRITQGPADAKFDIMPTQPLPTSPDPEIQPDIPGHKLFIHVTNQQTLNLTVEFVPLKEGEGIPAPQPVKALADWSVDTGAEKTTSQTLDGVVALKVDNPNAFARGAKTYVDTSNLDIKPIVQNGRTLVPVRFISENIGATVSWNDATQTVGIKTKAKNITLQLGSDQMMVDGAAVTLDVPAQEIGGRTLIPLRALVEALGKEVFWDDRGLILITDAPVTYDADKINKIIDLLDIRVQADGKEIKFFDSEVYNYNVEIAKGAAIPTISVISDKEAIVTQGSPATVTVDGKTYTFNFVENAFEGVLGTGSEGIAKTLLVTVKNAGALPTYQTYLDIASATSSIDWSDKYPMTGTYDGVINDETQNRWSANGIGNFVLYDLGEVKNLHSVAISGYKALSRSYMFDIEVSTDGVNYTKVCSEVPTELGVDRNVFKMGDVQARYVRVTATYSSNSTWVGISEIRFYDSAQMEADDQGAWNHYFYTSSINAMVGQAMQLAVEGKSKSGNPVDVNILDVKFTSDNPEIASVDANGVVTLNKVGTTTLRAEYVSMGITTYSTVAVNVEPMVE